MTAPSTNQPSAATETGTHTQPADQQRRQPPYHVLLHDDNDHTYEYVIEMLCSLFGHTVAQAFQMADEVDTTGRAVVDTTTLERAELKRDQIHAFGKDRRLPRSAGSMSSTIEPDSRT